MFQMIFPFLFRTYEVELLEFPQQICVVFEVESIKNLSNPIYAINVNLIIKDRMRLTPVI